MTKNVRNARMLCVSEFTLASSGSEMVVASFRGRESNVNQILSQKQGWFLC